jgi:hypothetical protein
VTGLALASCRCRCGVLFAFRVLGVVQEDSLKYIYVYRADLVGGEKKRPSVSSTLKYRVQTPSPGKRRFLVALVVGLGGGAGIVVGSVMRPPPRWHWRLSEREF